MSKFITELDVRLRDDCDSIFVLNTPLVYVSALLKCTIKVPHEYVTDINKGASYIQNFETDFASVPRIPFIYDAWGDRAHREAVIHDYLFRKDSIPVVSFMMANRVFLEAMECRGKPFYIRYPMFYGVCIGAYPSYHKRFVGDKL